MKLACIFCLLACMLIQQPIDAQRIQPDFVEETIDDIDIGYGVNIGDVDGDKRPDILLADQHQIVWYRNGDWERFVMADQLTERDNVCIAAQDIDGDGKVEVAVGAQWNPSETSDASASGAVYYLIRPKNPEKPWQPVALPHEPTVHRMQWVQTQPGNYQLVVLPLHGRGNKDGKGAGVKLIAYQMPKDPRDTWDTILIDQSMHLTHNMTQSIQNETTMLWVAGKEGIARFKYQGNAWQKDSLPELDQPTGEVSIGSLNPETPQNFVASIEPMHGNRLVAYLGEDYQNRTILYDDMNQGHAIACADLLGLGRDQIVVGWRNPNKQEKTGIKIFVPVDEEGDGWMHFYIDENGMACEDLKVADLDMDGDFDIVAAGRSTKNLKIYWNMRIRGDGKVN